MSHWAEIDENNIVLRVTVGDNEDPNGDEGYQWLIDNLGGTWIKTSYNSTIRKKFAGIGDFYDENLDGFVPVKPFDSWAFDTNSWIWNAPTPYPSDGKNHLWNEELLVWELVPESEG